MKKILVLSIFIFGCIQDDSRTEDYKKSDSRTDLLQYRDSENLEMKKKSEMQLITPQIYMINPTSTKIGFSVKIDITGRFPDILPNLYINGIKCPTEINRLSITKIEALMPTSPPTNNNGVVLISIDFNGQRTNEFKFTYIK